jgi:hypothetical protein
MNKFLITFLFLFSCSFIFSTDEVDVFPEGYIRSNEIDRVLLMGKDGTTGEIATLKVNKTNGALEVNATVTATAEVSITVEAGMVARPSQTGTDYHVLGSSVEGTIKTELYAEDSSSGSLYRAKGDSSDGSIYIKQVEALSVENQAKDASSGDFYNILGNSVEGTIRVELYAEDLSSGSLFNLKGKEDFLTANALLTAKNLSDEEFVLKGNTTEGNIRVQLYLKDYSTGELFPALGNSTDGCLWTNCYKNEVSLGVFSNITAYRLPAYGTVGNTTECTIWDYNTTGLIPYNYITDDYANGTTLYISSSSASDEATDTGALTIEIDLLDSNYLPVTETINLDGQTTVETVNTCKRINEVRVIKAGTGNTNAGIIYLHRSAVSSGVPSDSGKVYGIIKAGYSRSLKSQFTVPDGKRMLINRGSIGAGSGKEITIGVFVRNITQGVWSNQLPAVEYEQRMNVDFTYPVYFPEKTDIEIRAKCSASTVNVDANIYFILIDE